MKQIIFTCRSCEYLNRRDLGTPDYEFKQVTFESLTEAWEHLYDTYETDYIHDVIAEVNE